jgi:hypothetical protein
MRSSGCPEPEATAQYSTVVDPEQRPCTGTPLHGSETQRLIVASHTDDPAHAVGAAHFRQPAETCWHTCTSVPEQRVSPGLVQSLWQATQMPGDPMHDLADGQFDGIAQSRQPFGAVMHC